MCYNFERFFFVYSSLEDERHQFYYEYKNNFLFEGSTILGASSLEKFYPESIAGRGVTTVALVLSLIFLSVIVKIMFSKMQLSPKEESAYHLLE